MPRVYPMAFAGAFTDLFDEMRHTSFGQPEAPARVFLQHLRPSKWNGIPTWMMNTGNLQGLRTCTNTFVRTSGSVFPMNGKPWFQNLWIHKTCPEYRFRTNSANPKSKSPPFMKSYEVFIPFYVGNFENHVVIFKDFERSTRFFDFFDGKVRVLEQTRSLPILNP